MTMTNDAHETPQMAARRLAQPVIQKGFQPEALHVYHDQNNQPLYWRIRLKHPETQAKWIRPMHQRGEQTFVIGEPDFPGKKPLYQLPAIRQQPQATVWITEGEWCADKLNRLGIMATTSGGADSADAADWTPLANRTVIIWPDNDAAGLKYAQTVTTLLRTLNCTVQWVNISALNLPPKGDCVDWLRANPRATATEIAALSLQEPIVPVTPSIISNNKTTFSEKSSKSNSDFVVNDQGVFHSDGDEKRWICSRLEIQALVRDKASENWGRLLAVTDADRQIHRWAMPMEMLKGSADELRGELLRLGLQIAPGLKARQRLIEYITTTQPETRARCVTKTGWYQQVFVLPDHTIGATNEPVIYQADNIINPYQTSGTLVDWQRHIAAYCIGNSRLVLAISCGFAAVLLHPAGAESGGLHFIGESSTGKTTALKVAASVFGAPDYLQRWRATTNGIESLAALRSDTLLVLDELAQVDPKEAGEIAYLLANGSGKARAGKNGAARTRQEWRLLFLSAGEVGLAQHIREAGKKAKAGQTVRLVDVPADAGQGLGIFDTLHGCASGAALSKQLIDASAIHYGTAAQSFLECITQPDVIAHLSAAIQTHYQAFLEKNLPPACGGQVHRVCDRFALIAAGGELATYYNITGWPPGEAEQAATRCFQAWLEQRGHTDNQERTAFLAQVQAFFEAHGASRFEDMYPSNQSQYIINRVGFRQRNGLDQYEYFVLPEMFRREICQGVDPRWAAKILIEVGMLSPSSEGKAQTPHRLPGEGVKKCYHFARSEPEPSTHKNQI
jgi:putative DNA primase/helicase